MATVTETLPANMAPLYLLGYLFNWGLYGVLSCQVYVYYLAFPKDGRWTKLLVGGIYLIETAQTILVTHDAFAAYASGYGNLNALGSAQLEWLAVPTFSGIVSCAVQLYYGYRLRLLSGSNLLGLVIAVIALTQGTSAIVQGVQAKIIGDFADLATKAFVSCTIWLAGSATCDVIIAISMTFVLLRKDTQIPQTHAMITRIVRLVVETGCLTALAATIDLILFLSFQHNSYHGCVALTLAKLYSNSLMVIFNSRLRIVDGRNVTTTTITDSSVSFNRKSRISGNGRQTLVHLSTSSPPSAQLGQVQIRKELETWSDGGDAIPLEEQDFVYHTKA
ncbi:hypothetical protein SCHPADRAFT_918701 [Schizopora paradoxa]|uniref:DUF6534 domain-containing protein n=1 Tax=Schizopora paradoxa TaxID=27342 RepID=A0A0H2SQ38_9AGAM|nr:hypothetical protein SCHPADRAFT_918701 [Schizopora paradoxa]